MVGTDGEGAATLTRTRQTHQLRRVSALAIAVATITILAPLPADAYVRTREAGYIGSFVASVDQVCWAPNLIASPEEITITEARGYRRARQLVYLRARLQGYNSGWVGLADGPWRRRQIAADDPYIDYWRVQFLEGDSWTVGTGYYYRVILQVQWYVRFRSGWGRVGSARFQAEAQDITSFDGAQILTDANGGAYCRV